MLLTAGADRPLLAVRPHGKGRLAVQLSDETWRWAFNEETDGGAAHARLWRQFAGWLMEGELERPPRIVWVDADRRRYRQGERVRLNAHVVPAEQADVKNAAIILRVRGPDGARCGHRLP